VPILVALGFALATCDFVHAASGDAFLTLKQILANEETTR
jgi:hypothetical protein